VIKNVSGTLKVALFLTGVSAYRPGT
jgi:hypothetical protein